MRGLKCFATVCALTIGVCSHAENSVWGSIVLQSSEGIVQEDGSNIVVFIEGLDDRSRSLLLDREDSSARQISHKGMTYRPRVLPLVKNSTVDFLNDDRIFHNAFSLSKAKTFDLGIYAQGTSKYVTFGQPGLVRVYCNIHPDMISNILVLNNPFFTVTADDGSYRISDLPEGDYSLRVWSEYSEELRRPITVSANSQIEANFKVEQMRRFGDHLNKFGKLYRTKY